MKFSHLLGMTSLCNTSGPISSMAWSSLIRIISLLNNDGEFIVKEDATKAEIKRAFGKSLKGKKMNKKILSEFIELVA